MQSFYRHRADVLPSFIVLVFFTLQMSAYFLISDWRLLVWVAVMLLLCSASPGAISHNHHHSATFRYSWMNRCYEVMLFLETGITPYAWTIHHNIGHHRYYLEPSLDPSKWQNRDGTVMSRFKYDLLNACLIYPEIFRIGRAHPRLLKRFLLWSAVSLAALAILVAWHPLAGVILFVAPMPVMYVGLLDNTYQQHSALDMADHLTASRNTTHPLYNAISWNLGYHTTHHLFPGLHWSRLPERHVLLRERIPDGLVCHSLFLSACQGLSSGSPEVLPTVQTVTHNKIMPSVS